MCTTDTDITGTTALVAGASRGFGGVIATASMTPQSCGAVAGCSRSSSRRRSLTCSARQGDSDTRTAAAAPPASPRRPPAPHLPGK